MKKNYVLILRKLDGGEYKQVISANNEAEAERRLKNVLEMFDLRDEIVSLKPVEDD